VQLVLAVVVLADVPRRPLKYLSYLSYKNTRQFIDVYFYIFNRGELVSKRSERHS
jgi:hypothetical protein